MQSCAKRPAQVRACATRTRASRRHRRPLTHHAADGLGVGLQLDRVDGDVLGQQVRDGLADVAELDGDSHGYQKKKSFLRAVPARRPRHASIAAAISHGNASGPVPHPASAPISSQATKGRKQRGRAMRRMLFLRACLFRGPPPALPFRAGASSGRRAFVPRPRPHSRGPGGGALRDPAWDGRKKKKKEQARPGGVDRRRPGHTRRVPRDPRKKLVLRPLCRGTACASRGARRCPRLSRRPRRPRSRLRALVPGGAARKEERVCAGPPKRRRTARKKKRPRCRPLGGRPPRSDRRPNVNLPVPMDVEDARALYG